MIKKLFILFFVLISLGFARESNQKKEYNYIIYDLDNKLISKCMNTRSQIDDYMYKFTDCEDGKILVLAAQSFKYIDNTHKNNW